MPYFVSRGDYIGQRLFSTGAFERTTITGVYQYLSERPGRSGAFLDIGANIGVYSIPFSSLFGDLFAVEINPSTYHALEANVLMSKCENIKSINIGVSEQPGTTQLKVRKDGQAGWARLGDADPEFYESLDVQVTTIDRLVSEHRIKTVSVIKIDIEGHEINALKGARRTLLDHKPCVLYERLSKDDDQVFEYLKTLGYSTFFTFKRSKLWPLTRKSRAAQTDVYQPRRSGRYDLIIAEGDET